MTERPDCVWKDEGDPEWGPNYMTECGQEFCFIEGDRKENLFNYCPYCGKPIREYVYLPPLGEGNV